MAITNHDFDVLGVGWSKAANKYCAQITANGKTHHLGLFATAEDAQRAYLEAKRELHSGCTI